MSAKSSALSQILAGADTSSQKCQYWQFFELVKISKLERILLKNRLQCRRKLLFLIGLRFSIQYKSTVILIVCGGGYCDQGGIDHNAGLERQAARDQNAVARASA